VLLAYQLCQDLDRLLGWCETIYKILVPFGENPHQLETVYQIAQLRFTVLVGHDSGDLRCYLVQPLNFAILEVQAFRDLTSPPGSHRGTRNWLPRLCIDCLDLDPAP
jgi:hypothetical protein